MYVGAMPGESFITVNTSWAHGFHCIDSTFCTCKIHIDVTCMLRRRMCTKSLRATQIITGVATHLCLLLVQLIHPVVYIYQMGA